MKIPAYLANGAVPLLNNDYFIFLKQAINRAQKQIFVVIFIVDVRLKKDYQRSVRALVAELEYATWKGLDVRVVIGLSRNRTGHLASLTSALYMQELGISVRLFRPTNTDGIHCKFVLIDNNCLVTGSHNWTNNSFYINQEASVAVMSDQAVTHMINDFEVIWAHSEEPLKNAS